MTRTYRPHWALALATVLLASLATAPAQAQGGDNDNAEASTTEQEADANATQQKEDIDRKPATCVVVDRIKRGVVVNDRTVLFFMRGDVVYRNDLVQSCPGLEPGQTQLIYHFQNTGSSKLARLCDDAFSVERRLGPACSLGKYHPITPEEAQALMPPAQ